MSSTVHSPVGQYNTMPVWNAFQKRRMTVNTGLLLVSFHKLKPMARSDVVVLLVGNIVPTMSAWSMCSETRADFEACVIFARLECSSMLQTCYSSSKFFILPHYACCCFSCTTVDAVATPQWTNKLLLRHRNECTWKPCRQVRRIRRPTK